VGRSSTVATVRTVVSPLNEPSKLNTTSAPSAMERVASATAAHAEGGSQASSSWSVSWHSRARQNEASRIFGGKTDCKPSSARKSPRAGLARVQQWRQSTGWCSNAAAECSRHTTRGSAG
jgi:hypothetical protein